MALTLLRGREVPEATAAIQAGSRWAQRSNFDTTLADSLVGDRELTPQDVGRFSWALARVATGRYCRGVKLGVYRSVNGQTMLWGITHTVEREEWVATITRLSATVSENQAILKQEGTAAATLTSLRKVRKHFARGDALREENRRFLGEWKDLLKCVYVVGDLLEGREERDPERRTD